MGGFVKINGGDGVTYRVPHHVYKEASDELRARMAEDRHRLNVIDDEASPYYSTEVPPGDRTFLLAQLAIEQLQPTALVMNPDLNAEEAAAAQERGIVKGSFGNWALTLNHSSQKNGRLYAGNMLVTYKGAAGQERDVAIIGPWLTARRCWSCGMGGIVPGTNIGYVRPSHPCPTCGKLDWWDKDVTPEMLEEDCATLLADASPLTDQERRYKSFMNIRT